VLAIEYYQYWHYNSTSKNNTIIRLPYQKTKENKFNLNYYDLVKDLNIKIDYGDQSIDRLLKSTKLCLFGYDSTGFLENTHNNIPSIILENKNYLNSINSKQISKYKRIALNNIMFTDPNKLISFLNNNWHSIDNWWNSREIKKTIKFFNQDLNIKPKGNYLNKLVNYLKKYKIS